MINWAPERLERSESFGVKEEPPKERALAVRRKRSKRACKNMGPPRKPSNAGCVGKRRSKEA